MSEKVATYSKIISPEDYNRIITFEHVYISASDRLIKELIEKYMPTEYIGELVEVGCGPARILPLIAQIPGINLTGVDHDQIFINYAQKQLEGVKASVRLIKSDFSAYRHSTKVDVFYSQGVHHHIGKGDATKKYLAVIASQLADGGIYIVSDEFLPEYKDESDRKVKAVIWYSHVISSAKRIGQTYLAEEESKTLLDDLYETEEADIKNQEQIQLVLDCCTSIDEASRLGEFDKANQLATAFLKELSSLKNESLSGNDTIDLSRGDYKISDSVFRKEIGNSGFEVIERRTVGPVDTIGGMAVYVLKLSL